MKRIVLLGSSAAGVKMIEEIRASELACEITLIALDGHYPYQRDAFAPFLAGDISPENVFCRAKDFFETNHVHVILDKKITRINTKKRIIFTEDKERIEYDVLVVTDTPDNKFPNIKGTHKAGVYGYKKLKDIELIFNSVPLIDTIAIQSDSFTGLQAAAALIKRGKEVILISSKNGFISTHFQGDVAQWLASKFESVGFQIMGDDKIDEILGDKEVKAIRVKEGKVYSTQVVIFMECDEDLKLFADPGLRMKKQIEVNDQFQSSIESIYAVDQTSTLKNSEPVTPSLALEGQGIIVAAALNDQQRSIEALGAVLSFNMDGLVITALGQVEPKAGIEVRSTFDQEAGSYKCLFLDGEQLVGAVLVNAESEKDELLRLITEKRPVEAVSVQPVSDEVNSCTRDAEQGGEGDVSTELVDSQRDE